MNILKYKNKILKNMKENNYNEIEIKAMENYFNKIQLMKSCLTKKDFKFWMKYVK